MPIPRIIRNYCLIPALAIFLLSPASIIASEFDAQAFFAKMDLTGEAMQDVRAELQAGNTGKALARWRDAIVNRLRARDFGKYGWHGYAIHPKPTGVADLLTGKTPPEDYYAKPLKDLIFIDIYGMTAPPEQNSKVQWMRDIREIEDWPHPETANLPITQKINMTNHQNFETHKGFVAQYWRTGDEAYRLKLFQLMADFSANHYDQFWDMYRSNLEFQDDEVKYITRADWRLNTNGLGMGWRLRNFYRLMAGMFKCIGEDRPEDWDDVLAAQPSPLPREALDQSIDPVQLAQIAVSALEQHTPKLMWFCTEKSVPNQRMTGLAALAYTTIIFREFKQVPQIEDYIRVQLDQFLKYNFLPDGGNLEQSFNYNQGEIESLTELMQAYGEDLPGYLNILPRVIAARAAIDTGLRTPLGGLPQVGNQSILLGREVWKSPEAAKQWWSADIRKRHPVEPQPYTSIAFPYSGFYAMRDGWDIDSLYLFFMNGRPQRGHSMRDNLAIQANAFGRQLLVCAGSPTYNQYHTQDAKGAEFYLSEQSSFKNNTLLVDGKSQAKNADELTRAPQTPVPGRWHHSPRYDYVDGRYELGYETRPGVGLDMSVSHERSVVFLRKTGLWLLLDSMNAADNRSHRYTQVWNFPPELREERQDRSRAGFTEEQVGFNAQAKRCGTADPDGPNIEIHHFSPAEIEYEKYHGDREKWLGWFARGIGDAIPAVDLHANWKNEDSDHLLTLLVPRDMNSEGPLAAITALPGKIISGFEARTRTGASLQARAAGRHASLNIDDYATTAQLLLLHTDGESVSGIVKGADWLRLPDGTRLTARADCFEFHQQAGEWITIPIEMPHKETNDNTAELYYGLPREPDLTNATGLTQGLRWNYAEYPKNSRLYDLMKRAEIAPLDKGHAGDYSTADWNDHNRFGLLFQGYLKVPADGLYTFHLAAPQSAAIFIHNPQRELMGPPLAFVFHARHEHQGTIPLKAGLHELRIEYQRHLGGPNTLDLEIEGPGIERQKLPADWLYTETSTTTER